MFRVLGVLQVFLVFYITYKSYKKQGVSIVVDSVKIMGLIWLFALGMYNIALSAWYSPNTAINVVVGIIVLIFFIISKKFYIKDEEIEKFMSRKTEEFKMAIYSIVANLIFVLAAIIFIDNVLKYGLVILSSENKIDKQPIDHYAGYIIYMLSLVAQIKYILFRKRKKVTDILLFIVSIGILVATLNRGPIAFIASAIYLYEIFNFIKERKNMSKKKIYTLIAILCVSIILFAQFFAIIGNMRMEHVLNDIYKISLNEHYKINGMFPAAFVWLYMYMTSPLENAAFSIVNQVADTSFFNNLFYPFIKFFANLFGQGEAYKEWVSQSIGYVPHLDGNPGLNVSSFIPQAMQDMGYIGVVIYVAIYVGLAYAVIKIIQKRNLSFIGSFIIYANVLNLLLWSIFENSLRVPIILLNIILAVFIEIFMKLKIFKKVERIYWKIKKK